MLVVGASPARLAPIALEPQSNANAAGEKNWCERGDSNPHGFTRQILSLVRLPIPPLSHLAETAPQGTGTAIGQHDNYCTATHQESRC